MIELILNSQDHINFIFIFFYFSLHAIEAYLYFSAPPMPLNCYHGDIYSEGTDVLILNGQCEGIQLKLITGG